MNRWIRILITGMMVVTAATPILIPSAVSAQESIKPLIIECDRVVLDSNGVVDKVATDNNRCKVTDFVQQFVDLAAYGLTIVVFLAALMLVYGGFEFITAGGRQSKISSGQNIITGTVIGLLVSLSAFVIINFVVGAITGTKTSANPFTAIATVFGRPDQTDLVRPFSGSGEETSPSTCRAEWDTSCADQILCADPADQNTSGTIASLQSRLNQLGCGCGTVDGCFGAQTLTCVRRFQIANTLVPTGTINPETNDALAEANPVSCNSTTDISRQISTTLAALPRPTANVSDVTTGNSGCCVVNKNITSTALTPMYCIDELDYRACKALGPDVYFVSGKRCTEDSETIKVCGFCQSAGNSCFQQAGQYWCEKVAKESGSTTPLTFTRGVCSGLAVPGGICSNGCDNTLKTVP